MDNLVTEFNSKTELYKLNDEEAELAKNTLKSLYYNQIPTNAQNNWFSLTTLV